MSNKNKTILTLFIVLILVIIPIYLNYQFFGKYYLVSSNYKEIWLSFYGSYYGGILGALVTIYGSVYITNKNLKTTLDNQERLSFFPVLLIIRIRKSLDIIDNNLYIFTEEQEDKFDSYYYDDNTIKTLRILLTTFSKLKDQNQSSIQLESIMDFLDKYEYISYVKTMKEKLLESISQQFSNEQIYNELDHLLEVQENIFLRQLINENHIYLIGFKNIGSNFIKNLEFSMIDNKTKFVSKEYGITKTITDNELKIRIILDKPIKGQTDVLNLSYEDILGNKYTQKVYLSSFGHITYDSPIFSINKT